MKNVWFLFANIYCFLFFAGLLLRSDTPENIALVYYHAKPLHTRLHACDSNPIPQTRMAQMVTLFLRSTLGSSYYSRKRTRGIQYRTRILLGGLPSPYLHVFSVYNNVFSFDRQITFLNHKVTYSLEGFSTNAIFFHTLRQGKTQLRQVIRASASSPFFL